MKILFLFALFVLVGVISSAFVYAETVPVDVSGTSHDVVYTGTGVTVSGIDSNLDFFSLKLNVSVSGSPGILKITLERSFFDAMDNGADADFIVLADGDEPLYSEIKTTSQSRTLSITLPTGTETVEIIGTQFGQSEPTPEPVPVEEPVPATPLIIATEDAREGSPLSISITSTLENKVYFMNYNIYVIQNEEVILDKDIHYEEYCTPSCEGVGYKTIPLPTTSPINIQVTFQGYGSSEESELFGPIGEVITLQVVPKLPIPLDDLPFEITITAASGSSTPGCETTAGECYIPKIASVANGGKVIFSNTDTAAHTFTSGTPQDGPTGEFDTSLVMVANSYEWTPTREGQFDYYCMVHPWMTGIIFVGEGTYIPPTEDDFDLQVIMENKVYDLTDTATMNLFIDGISTPQNVALEISGPSGSTVISRSFEVDSEGVSFEFRIDENFKTGTYKVIATTSNDGNTVTDVAYFKVKSQYNSFKITSVQVTDQQGNPSNLEKGEMGFIKVNLEANKSITTLVTVNLFDSDLTSIGIGSIKTTLSSGNSEIILSFMIPVDASIGPANIYVNAFSDWPSNGGIPLTGEVSITENIE